MYQSVTNVKALDDFYLELTFENNELRLFDVKPYLNHSIFRELKNQKLFKSVHVSFDTIEWDNHADIDPETLYEDSVPV